MTERVREKGFEKMRKGLRPLGSVITFQGGTASGNIMESIVMKSIEFIRLSEKR